ncbi:MAG: ABC-2 transporter permease [Clostridia bacterium]|nr:ABC-2 transporter permease [Clostridia bacterium]
MKNLLYKEFSLCLPMQVPLFLCFSFFILIPNYPYLVAGFFICNAIFYSFVQASADNDTLFSLLLPVSKAKTVKGKMTYVICIQTAALILFAAVTLLSSVIGKGENDAGTDASLTLLGGYLLMFCVFNLSYVPHYFKAPHTAGRRFLFSALCMLGFAAVFEGFMIAAKPLSETLPFFSWVENNLDVFPNSGASWTAQIVFFIVCAALYAILNAVCTKTAIKNFELAEV